MTNPTKNTDLQEGQRDPDLANALIALKRAARKVRENAQKTGVPVVYMKDRKIMEEDLSRGIINTINMDS